VRQEVKVRTSCAQSGERIKALLLYDDHYAFVTDENKGDEAIVHQTIEILQSEIPNMDFTMFHRYSPRSGINDKVRVLKLKGAHRRFSPTLSSLLLSLLELFSCTLYILASKMSLDASFLLEIGALREFYSTDIIIYPGGDGFTQEAGFFKFLLRSIGMLVGLLLRKPIVCLAETMGPFEAWPFRYAATQLLNRAKLITLREPRSYNFVRHLPVTQTKTRVTACPAFTLSPVCGAKVDQLLRAEGIRLADAEVVIGISPNSDIGQAMLSRSKTGTLIRTFGRLAYFGLPESLFRLLLKAFSRLQSHQSHRERDLAEIIDNLVISLDAKVIIIPHDFTVRPFANDKELAAKIHQRVNHRERVYLLTQDCSAQEVKAIIRCCDLFIGERLHACIAAISQFIPTLGISYGHKFEGVFRMAGLEEYICRFSKQEILEKVNSLYLARPEITKRLKSRVKQLQKRAMVNGILVRKVLERSWRSGDFK